MVEKKLPLFELHATVTRFRTEIAAEKLGPSFVRRIENPKVPKITQFGRLNFGLEEILVNFMPFQNFNLSIRREVKFYLLNDSFIREFFFSIRFFHF